VRTVVGAWHQRNGLGIRPLVIQDFSFTARSITIKLHPPAQYPGFTGTVVVTQ